MATTLPILMPSIGGQRWSCHSCGDCCRTLVGHLTDAERERLDGHNWGEALGAAPYVKIPRGWALNKRSDGACVFLTEDNRCRIHAQYGEAAKPLACRIFPFSARRVPHGWQMSLRFDCPSVASAEGASLDQHRAGLELLSAELEGTVGAASRRPMLRRGRPASPVEIEALDRCFERWLTRGELAIGDRLIGAARLVETLESARLDKIADERFVEVLKLLATGLPADAARAASQPTVRQQGMLRQYAFAHAEHVSLDELRGGFLGGISKRFQQLRKARRFLRGTGAVPPLPGVDGTATFEEVDAIRPATAPGAGAIEDLLRRYLTARFEGSTVYGGGFYGWPAIAGIAACLLSVAAAGWLGRYRAAAARRTRLEFSDVATALAIVDRAATRLPALGTLAERTRIAYLLGDDAIARLLRRYALTENSV